MARAELSLLGEVGVQEGFIELGLVVEAVADVEGLEAQALGLERGEELRVVDLLRAADFCSARATLFVLLEVFRELARDLDDRLHLRLPWVSGGYRRWSCGALRGCRRCS